MGGGWETRRRRGEGYDWAIVQLAGAGHVELFEVDTQHFKGNYPDRCSIEAIALPGASITTLLAHSDWKPLVAESKLSADSRHFFRVSSGEAVTHVRLNIFPDGGVSRLRVWGRI
jgi:allantoicase